MKTGVFRRIDDLLRIVIPKELCKQANIKPDDPLEISVVDHDGAKAILLTPYRVGNDEMSRIKHEISSLESGLAYLYPKFAAQGGGIALVDKNGIVDPPRSKAETIIARSADYLFTTGQKGSVRTVEGVDYIHILGLPIADRNSPNENAVSCVAVLYAIGLETFTDDLKNSFFVGCKIISEH